jgi:hypothetical protein
MTKVQLSYALLHKLTDADAEAISNVYGHYGFNRIQIAPSLDQITVDYDATRMSPKDVQAVLVRYGVPLALVVGV